MACWEEAGDDSAPTVRTMGDELMSAGCRCQTLRSRAYLAEWLSRPCGWLFVPNSTHCTYRVAKTHGRWICTQCGGQSRGKVVAKLGKPCQFVACGRPPVGGQRGRRWRR